jgi:hypothetical protein
MLPLKHSFAGTTYPCLVTLTGKVMRRMNFEQRSPRDRDIGGAPGPVLLLVATALVLWTLGLVLRGGV